MTLHMLRDALEHFYKLDASNKTSEEEHEKACNLVKACYDNLSEDDKSIVNAICDARLNEIVH